ncbi:hypothetical protein pclt_cds_1084 [Pandoravirus celtis]|uniref:Uncharacterized protein n=1 Tax=Pandoravirus celtis TaxID=2568002 RepID=A0A4D6EIX8_9VIRU|nr:hypothetical protein pclt_cds_1084 [Pandoravirus celtis]
MAWLLERRHRPRLSCEGRRQECHSRGKACAPATRFAARQRYGKQAPKRPDYLPTQKKDQKVDNCARQRASCSARPRRPPTTTASARGSQDEDDDHGGSNMANKHLSSLLLSRIF